MKAEVVSVRVTRRELTAQKVPALRTLFRLERLPLGESDVVIEIRGVPTAVANGLRRAVMDEMPGRALVVAEGGWDFGATTDPYMLPDFVGQRISLIPLRAQVAAGVAAALSLRLDVTNRGPTVLSVYSGDLTVEAGTMPEPLFNPTFTLATLQPGKRIVINKIRVATGFGRDNGIFNVARRGAAAPLDLPQHTDADMREEKGIAADESGFKVSCMVANPRHHRVSAVLPATSPVEAEARAVFADACDNIIARLRLAEAAVGRPAGQHGAQFTVVRLEEGLNEGILQIPGETHTIGELVRRAVYEARPEVSFVAHTVVPHEGLLVLTVRDSEDVAALLLRAIHDCVAAYETISRGLGG